MEKGESLFDPCYPHVLFFQRKVAYTSIAEIMTTDVKSYVKIDHVPLGPRSVCLSEGYATAVLSTLLRRERVQGDFQSLQNQYYVSQ